MRARTPHASVASQRVAAAAEATLPSAEAVDDGCCESSESAAEAEAAAEAAEAEAACGDRSSNLLTRDSTRRIGTWRKWQRKGNTTEHDAAAKNKYMDEIPQCIHALSHTNTSMARKHKPQNL